MIDILLESLARNHVIKDSIQQCQTLQLLELLANFNLDRMASHMIQNGEPKY